MPVRVVRQAPAAARVRRTISALPSRRLRPVARSTIYDLMLMKVLASVKVGRYRKVPVTQLRAYVDALTRSCAA